MPELDLDAMQKAVLTKGLTGFELRDMNEALIKELRETRAAEKFQHSERCIEKSLRREWETRAERAETAIAALLDDGLTSALHKHDGQVLHVGRAREIYVDVRAALQGPDSSQANERACDARTT